MKIFRLFSLLSAFSAIWVGSAAQAQTTPPAKQFFGNEFADVCSGVALSGAAAYSKTPGKVHPVLVFVKEKPTERFQQTTGNTPTDWEKMFPNLGETELVACLTVKESAKAKDCPFKIDGNDYTVEMQNAKYDVAVYEAKTGKALGQTSFDLKAGECPMVKFFSKKVEQQYPDYKESLIQFLKPHVQP